MKEVFIATLVEGQRERNVIIHEQKLTTHFNVIS